MPQSEASRLVQRLRWQADFIARHQDLLERLESDRDLLASEQGINSLDVEYEQITSVYISPGYSLILTVSGPRQRAVTKKLIRAIGGTWKKGGYGDTMSLTRTFEDGLTVRVQGERTMMCEKVVTGTETVEIPAVEAQPARTEEREIVEWDCGTLLPEGQLEGQLTQ